MSEKPIENMTRKDFEALPAREHWSKPVKCNSIVLLPTRQMHDSGYRVMDFVACNGNRPVCRLSGCSDVLNLDGIGGYGWKWTERYVGVPKMIPPSGWSVDCLPRSGLLRIFPYSWKMECGAALSNFEIYACPAKGEQK